VNATLESLVHATKARKVGSGYMGICPAHDDHKPSLSISVGKKLPVVFNCMSAGCSFREIAAALEEKFGITIGEKESVRQAAADRVADYIYRDETGRIVAKKARSIDSVGGRVLEWFRPDPNNPGKWLKGLEGIVPPLYRLPELLAADPSTLVVIVEGEKDADRLASLGLVATTTPHGASANWREDDTKHLRRRHRVCVIADDDAPGEKKALNTEAALRGPVRSVAVLRLPNPDHVEHFDASDFLDYGGTTDTLRKLIEASFQIPVEIVRHEALAERLLELWDKGDPPGAYPGWEALGPYYRPRLGELTVVTGAPGAGKSTFIDDLMIRTAFGSAPLGEHAAGWNWVVYSAEQLPVQRHASKLLQKLTGKPFGRGVTERMTKFEMLEGLHHLHGKFSLLDPGFWSATVDRILEVAKDAKRRGMCDALLLDPYNIVAATSRPKAMSEHDFINEFLAKLRAFVHSENVHAIVVAHPTKLQKEPGESEYPPVKPWNISGSAHWYNHADAILSIWRAMKDEERVQRGEVEIHVQKIRFQPECGQVGMVKLYFDRVTTRYHEEPVRFVRPVTRELFA
jgi:twinkle protein